MKRTLALLIFLSLGLSACFSVTGPITKKQYSSPEDPLYMQELLESDRLQYLKQHPQLNQRLRRLISEGRLVRGMTKDEVKASWGMPDTVYRTKTNTIVNEQWIYKNIDPRTLIKIIYILNFRSEKLASWQEQ